MYLDYCQWISIMGHCITFKTPFTVCMSLAENCQTGKGFKKKKKICFQSLREAKPAQLLPLFCFVVCWHCHGHQFSRVYALLGGWWPVTCPPFFFLVLFLRFGSKTKAARSPVRKAIVYVFNLQVKSIFWLFLMYVLETVLEYAVCKLRNIFFSYCVISGIAIFL